MKKYLFVVFGVTVMPTINASDNVASLSPTSKKEEKEAKPSSNSIGNDNRIAIVVGKKPITVSQIEARARLIRLSREPEGTGKPSDALLKEAAQALVAELIKRNTCERVKVTVPETEIDDHMKRLAEQNGMTLDDMEKFFKSKGIPLNIIRDSIYVQTAWPRAVQANVQVIVSDQEVQKMLDAETSSFDQDRVELGEIVIYADTAERRNNAVKRLNDIAATLRKGTSFAVVAQQSSESSSAASEGNIGWFTEGKLKDDERHALNNKPVGYCSDPLPCSGGYRILYVLDRQYPGELPLSQAHIACTVARLPFSPEWTYEKQEIFSRMIATLTECTDEDSFKKRIKEWQDVDSSSKVESLKPMALHDLPPEVARLVINSQGTGVAVGPLRLPNNQLIVVFIKSRVRVKGQSKPTFEQIQAMVYEKKIKDGALREFAHLKASTAVDYLLPQFGPEMATRQA